MLLWISAAVAGGLWLYCWSASRRHPPDFPPGPRLPLPLIGDAYVLGKDVTSGFRKLSKKYGDIVGLWLGPQRTVVLNTAELIHETMGKDEYADRPDFPVIEATRGRCREDGIPGVIFLNGHSWMEQRRFALRTLRDLGFGKTGMEDLVAEEVEALCARIEEEKGRYLQMRGFFNRSALKALWKVLTNEDLDVTRSNFLDIWKRMEKAFELANIPLMQVAFNFPIVSTILEKFGIETFDIVFKDFIKLANDIITSHEETFQEDNLRDFTDAFLKTRHDNASNPSSSFHGRDGLLNQQGILNDIIQAGTDTTSITTSWAVLYMILHPDVQKKVQDELDAVTGRGRLPSWADRTSTPYTEAVLHEVQRCANIVPNGVPHATRTDVRLRGYTIPKGTTVFPNLDAVLTDPKIFPDPERFDPGRYLSGDGRFEPHPNVIPFGVGKRRCLGETLARIELYRFFTGVMHSFTAEKRPGAVLSTRPQPGAASMTPPFEARFLTRE